MKVNKKDYAELLQLQADALPDEHINKAERLGGMTNRTYHVQGRFADYLFRLPGAGTEALINRKDERISTELASALGIDAELLFFDENTGRKVCRYVDHAETLDAGRMKEAGIIRKLAQVLRQLHESGVDTTVDFDIAELILRYESIVNEAGTDYCEGYAEIRDLVFQSLANEKDLHKVPCHNDPLCENWVLSGERLFLVDWEYAGMNDPMWDLADISLEADYAKKDDSLLLRNYFTAGVSEWQRLRFLLNKVYIDFLWSLWGKTREAYEGKVMRDYAEFRFARLVKNVAVYQRR